MCIDNEKYFDICENLGWIVNDCGNGDIELEKHSPAGEDFLFIADAGNFIDSVMEYVDDFDIDEHIELFINYRGKNGVPSSVRELLEDAEAIKKMLLELASALKEEMYTQVYVVIGGCCDDYHIIAIYKSKAEAEKRAEQENKECNGLDAQVEEWKVSE